jgi:hypothetical protein
MQAQVLCLAWLGWAGRRPPASQAKPRCCAWLGWAGRRPASQAKPVPGLDTPPARSSQHLGLAYWLAGGRACAERGSEESQTPCTQPAVLLVASGFQSLVLVSFVILRQHAADRILRSLCMVRLRPCFTALALPPVAFLAQEAFAAVAAERGRSVAGPEVGCNASPDRPEVPEAVAAELGRSAAEAGSEASERAAAAMASVAGVHASEAEGPAAAADGTGLPPAVGGEGEKRLEQVAGCSCSSRRRSGIRAGRVVGASAGATTEVAGVGAAGGEGAAGVCRRSRLVLAGRARRAASEEAAQRGDHPDEERPNFHHVRRHSAWVVDPAWRPGVRGRRCHDQGHVGQVPPRRQAA